MPLFAAMKPRRTHARTYTSSERCVPARKGRNANPRRLARTVPCCAGGSQAQHALPRNTQAAEQCHTLTGANTSRSTAPSPTIRAKALTRPHDVVSMRVSRFLVSRDHGFQSYLAPAPSAALQLACRFAVASSAAGIPAAISDLITHDTWPWRPPPGAWRQALELRVPGRQNTCGHRCMPA